MNILKYTEFQMNKPNLLRFHFLWISFYYYTVEVVNLKKKLNGRCAPSLVFVTTIMISSDNEEEEENDIASTSDSSEEPKEWHLDDDLGK